MRHYMECDNCGKTVQVHCYNPDPDILHYYIPPLPPMAEHYTVEEYLAEVATRGIISICKECKNQ